MEKLRVHDKNFEIYLEEKVLKKRVAELADEIYRDLNGKTPHFVSVLNGSFIFASDLLRAFPSTCKISFIKLSSYDGIKSTGLVREAIGLNEVLREEEIIVIEDIVDTGTTILKIDDIFKVNRKDWKVVSLFCKPKAYKGIRKIDFIGFEIPNDFIVGYGLDYKGIGRNLKNVYQLAKA